MSVHFLSLTQGENLFSNMNKKLQTGLVAIFILLLGLLTRPLITIPTGELFSIPVLLIYILLVWVGLVVLMRWVFSIKSGTDQDSEEVG